MLQVVVHNLRLDSRRDDMFLALQPKNLCLFLLLLLVNRVQLVLDLHDLGIVLVSLRVHAEAMLRSQELVRNVSSAVDELGSVVLGPLPRVAQQTVLGAKGVGTSDSRVVGGWDPDTSSLTNGWRLSVVGVSRVVTMIPVLIW